MSVSLKQLITKFLELNPEPSDAQFHALAEACGVDKETLEAVAYKMLGREVNDGESQDVESLVDVDEVEASLAISDEADLSQDQKVQDGDYDETNVPADDLLTNDGELALDDPDTGFQEETNDDGFDASDEGIGIQDQDVLTDDGVPDTELE